MGAVRYYCFRMRAIVLSLSELRTRNTRYQQRLFKVQCSICARQNNMRELRRRKYLVKISHRYGL